jgi:Uncharacterized protein conserved in bacteria (DUF2330)
MKKTILFLFITFIMVFADGAIIPSSSSEIYSSDQIALIKYFEGVEELSLLVKTYYIYQSAAWIIPLPASPAISEVNTDLFLDLAEMSKPVYLNQPGYDYGCSGYYGPAEGTRGEDYFVIEEAHIFDLLSTVVINTNQADSLRNWLVNNGYLVNDKVFELFQEYITKNWDHFFCARTIDTLAYNRNALGIMLVFNSETPVFPLKISQANFYSSYYYPGLFLYVVDSNKMTFTDSKLLYANKIDTKELKEIQKDFPDLGNYLKAGDYLTKLFKEYQSASELEDITLEKAKDDKEYRELYRSRYQYSGMGIPLFPFILLLLLLIMKAIYRLKQHRKSE